MSYKLLRYTMLPRLILFGEDGYRNLREQDISREHYLEANARIEWFKYRMEKKKGRLNDGYGRSISATDNGESKEA